MTRTKMSDGTHDVRTKPPGHSDRIYGQLQDICGGIRDSRIENDPEGITGENCTLEVSGHGTGHADAEKHTEEADLSAKIDQPEAAKLARIKEHLEALRYNNDLSEHPYPHGIEGLKTVLVCTLNSLLELVYYLEKRDG